MGAVAQSPAQQRGIGHEPTDVAGKPSGPFGLEPVIAFYGEFHEKVPCQNFNATGMTWFKLLQNPVEAGAELIARFPKQPFAIDEFGFDYDGGIDLKTAGVLRAAKNMNRDLQVAVWQMRGPVAPLLAAAYRETVGLVLVETYRDLSDAWQIAFHLQSARLNGLLDRTVIGLGFGGEGNIAWTRTKEELEQQLRLIRFVAPESPGVGFFGQEMLGKILLTAEEVQELCRGLGSIPTDGKGLKPELLKLGKTFTERYAQPAIFCSPSYVEPNYDPGHLGADGKWSDWGQLAKPMSFRALMMNLGEIDARELIVRLRNRGQDGEVWAKGIVDIPAHSIAVAVLPVLQGKEWKGWVGSWLMEVEAPGCKVETCYESRFNSRSSTILQNPVAKHQNQK
ncbi:MAG: hypothetical protein ACLQU3_12835 [Limisphaerales bacterium]